MPSNLTKQAIARSFMKLLNQQPLDKITVKDIVEDCGVNRNTFYYHYQDIYALLREIFETEVSKVIAENPLLDSWQEGFIQSTRFALENKRAIYHIYHSAQRAVLDQYLLQVTDQMVQAFVQAQAQGLDVAEEDIRYIVVFYKHAVVGVTLEWLERGMKDDAEVVIRRMGQIFQGTIRTALEKVADPQPCH